MDEVIETTNEAAEDVNVFIQYLQDHIPNLISFAIEIVLALIFFFLGRIVIKWIRKLIRKMLERSNVDKGVETFVDSLLKFMLYGMLLFTIATKFGFDTASVAALIASAGVAVGLAVQGSLSNFAGGILILLLKPFVVGDYIIEDNHGDEGTVKEIQLFYTKLLTVDNRTVVIPNGMLTNNSLTNVTHMDERKLELKVSISYESDLLKAKAVLAGLIRKDSRIIQDKEHRIFVDELGDDGVILGMRCWVSTEDYWNVRWDMLEDIKLTFDRESIVIPYHQMNVRIQESN
ncbi:mechanosensitive ion channel family protein [Dorea sp. AM58-8]|uniref:mechanosensitive ion channel family protein n=1 Tax=Dorea sp. AM58-8 TaxID=2292346 RepID=UPI000E4DCE31|nr:mechanosensitive ion channel domain-containing protein [Dorea sp. AM58-8]RGY80872.1 mechanosensitive ion channel family protein [Dorea sp. AM58-8]